MADFRKYLYALAIVAMLALATVPASAQALVCDQPVGVNSQLRSGNYAELAGDFTFSCISTGTNTPNGQLVPIATLRLRVSNANFNPRYTEGTTFVESVMLVDEPASANQRACGQTGSGETSIPGVCAITSDGNPFDTYNGLAGHPNVFQGRKSASSACNISNCVEFLGVPLDPPATTARRTFRFKNMRVNLGNVAPGPTVRFTLEVVDSQTSVAFTSSPFADVGTVVQNTLTASFGNAGGFTICTSANGQNGGSVTINEPTTLMSSFRSVGGSDQDNPTAGYYTESGYTMSAANLLANTNGHGMNLAGRATQGTQIAFNVSAPAGVTVTWPASVLFNDGLGQLNQVTLPTASFQVYEVSIPAGGNTNLAAITQQVAVITPTISYSANTLSQSSVYVGNPSLWPNTGNLSTSGPAVVPYWNAQPGPADNVNRIGNDIADISPCQCSLLFPWVVNNSGYVTGIAVSNTSKDLLNSINPQAGVVRLYLYGTNSAATSTTAALSQTSSMVAAGTSATFLVSGISGGFQGYAVTQADFQFCHGVAYVAPTSGAATLSYLGLTMDGGFPLFRNFNRAETLEH